MPEVGGFYGLRSRDGLIVDATVVENGKACGCVCPLCRMLLVAKNNGTIVRPHFAHESESDCKGGYETALHRLAKEVLSQHPKLFLPEIRAYSSDKAILPTWLYDLVCSPD